MHAGSRTLALLVLFALGMGPLVPAVFAQEKASELENLKKQMSQIQEQLQQLQRQIEKLEKQNAPSGAAGPPPAADPGLQKKIDEVEGKADVALAATKKTFASQFNPSISVGVDTIASYKSHRQGFNPGDGTGTRDAGQPTNNDRPAGADFNLRSAELFVSADVDPFARAYATINASADANPGANDEATLSVEEAAIVTTRLPYNLMVRGGRFFADFGTLGHRHDHDLPFVDRPPSLVALAGGETQTNGVELSWLAPTSLFLRLSGTVGNKIGADFQDGVSNLNSRPIRGLTYLGRLQTYFDINDDNSLDLGGSIAETPNAEDFANTGRFERRLVGFDFKYRWYPLGSGVRQSLTVAGELFHDVGEADPINGGRRVDVFGNAVRQGAWGGYAYAEYRLSKQWRPGVRFDYLQPQSEPLLVTNPFTGMPASTLNATGHRTDNRTWTAYITWFPSEFQRLRLQYNRSDLGNAQDAHQFFLQWTAFIGSHSHGFSERE